jgi:LAO/AO transport system kinase
LADSILKTQPNRQESVSLPELIPPFVSIELKNAVTALPTGDIPALARVLTWIENDLEGSESILQSLQPSQEIPVIGFTGPPGAGKSTLINALIGQLSAGGKKVAVLAVDPTSPFNYGSLLGDRLRMSEHFTDPNVFIRSVASRGSLGGLSEKVIELVDVLRCGKFDMILVETVGVGQSEIEIAGLADTTVVVVVPEAGDEIQTMKSGIMEVADVFVVNKSDREGADTLLHALKQLVAHPRANGWQIPVVKAIASMGKGLEEVLTAVNSHRSAASFNEKRLFLLAEKAYKIIQQRRMKNVQKDVLVRELQIAVNQADFNLYRFVFRMEGPYRV